MNQNCLINGKIIKKKSSINEFILKYKIKGEQNDSYILYDEKSNTFCHIISDIITDSMIEQNDISEGNNDEIKSNILIPRRVIFVIDRSGSMSGSKWNKTISATINALKQLRVNYDRFCIILFDHNIDLVPNDEMVLADNKNISQTIQYLENKNVGGSTDINKALLSAIKLIKCDIKKLNNNNNKTNNDKDDENYNFFMNQIIFITDGEPNNGVKDTKEIILNIKKKID